MATNDLKFNIRTEEAVQNDGNTHVCWLVRHGQRADEVLGFRESEWALNNTNRWPLDVPLTELGHEMAMQGALNFQKSFPENSHGLEVIFTSPLHRALRTALQFAKVLKLGLCIVPGLADCTAWCSSKGPIMQDSEGNLTLPNDRYNNNVFLTNTELRNLCEDVEVSFYPLNLDYMSTLNMLVTNYPRSMCVCHREGIRDAVGKGGRLQYVHIEQLNYNFQRDVKKIYIENLEHGTLFKGFPKPKRERRRHK